MLSIFATRLYRFFLPVFFISILTFPAQAQKGEKSITIGPVISFPQENIAYYFGELETGFGLEATGQKNISNKSALLIQFNFTTYGTSANGLYYGFNNQGHHAVTSIRAGYQYQFSKPGILLNALPSLEFESGFDVTTCLVLGVGKRFKIKQAYFIDAGIDYLASGFNNRVNIKAAFSVFRRPKPQDYKLW